MSKVFVRDRVSCCLTVFVENCYLSLPSQLWKKGFCCLTVQLGVATSKTFDFSTNIRQTGKTQRLDFTVFQISSIYSKYSKCYPNILCPRSTFYFSTNIRKTGKTQRLDFTVFQSFKGQIFQIFQIFSNYFSANIRQRGKTKRSQDSIMFQMSPFEGCKNSFPGGIVCFLWFYENGETIQEFGTFTFIEEAFKLRMAILLRIMLFSRRKVFMKIDGHISLQNVVGILYFQSLSNNSTTFVMEFCIAYLEQTSFRNIINLRSNLLLALSYFFMDSIKVLASKCKWECAVQSYLTKGHSGP